jgi:hypothetical protein
VSWQSAQQTPVPARTPVRAPLRFCRETILVSNTTARRNAGKQKNPRIALVHPKFDLKFAAGRLQIHPHEPWANLTDGKNARKQADQVSYGKGNGQTGFELLPGCFRDGHLCNRIPGGANRRGGSQSSRDEACGASGVESE